MSEFSRQLEAEIPRLRRYARAMTRDGDRADDLVQNCLVRALANQQRWQTGTNLRAWLCTILHNLHVSDLRRSVRERNRCMEFGSLGEARSDPGALLDRFYVGRAIARLPSSQRQALLLVDLEDMSYAEAAAELGVPFGTLRSRLGRARTSLRELFGRDAPTPARIRDDPRRAIANRAPSDKASAVAAHS
jgi:RNA polymerase sigma-70 factor, ECF subfamily